MYLDLFYTEKNLNVKLHVLITIIFIGITCAPVGILIVSNITFSWYNLIIISNANEMNH